MLCRLGLSTCVFEIYAGIDYIKKEEYTLSHFHTHTHTQTMYSGMDIYTYLEQSSCVAGEVVHSNPRNNTEDERSDI